MGNDISSNSKRNQIGFDKEKSGFFQNSNEGINIRDKIQFKYPKMTSFAVYEGTLLIGGYHGIAKLIPGQEAPEIILNTSGKLQLKLKRYSNRNCNCWRWKGNFQHRRRRNLYMEPRFKFSTKKDTRHSIQYQFRNSNSN